jgi:2-polyprenyl-3-methyl-5-hydroxy-6-metoxy-1,4-benzoquinol methylase
VSATPPAGLAPNDPAFDISHDADLAALLFAEEHHFWHRARNRVILHRLRSIGIAPGQSVLELGCGAGSVASSLARHGYRVTGIEGHPALVEVAKRRCRIASFLCRDLRSGLPASGDRGPFDAVALFDVIEHLDDPAALLQMALGCVRDGGVVVGTVPALMFLWSGIDEHSGHKTRYSASSLRVQLGRVAHAKVVEIGAFFRSLVPILWAQRLVVGRRGDGPSSARNLAVPWAPVNMALDALCRIEERMSPLCDRVGIPGASLWFAIRREQSAR